MAIPKKILADIVTSLGKAVAADDAAILAAVHRCLANYHTPPRSTTGANGPAGSKREAKATKTGSMPIFDEPNDLSTRFAAFENRDALGAFIRSNFTRKLDVIAVARALRVPVAKEDDYEIIVEKLIDGTIGYKLRSRAIRGDDTTRS